MTVKILGKLDENCPKQYLTIFNDMVKAGFPSPASDYVQDFIDLNDLLMGHPNSTYIVELEGYSLKDIGLFPGDLLIVDRSLTPKHRDIVIALIDDGFTTKELILGDPIILKAHNEEFADIIVTDNLEIFGVVKHAIRRLRK